MTADRPNYVEALKTSLRFAGNPRLTVIAWDHRWHLALDKLGLASHLPAISFEMSPYPARWVVR